MEPPRSTDFSHEEHLRLHRQFVTGMLPEQSREPYEEMIRRQMEAYSRPLRWVMPKEPAKSRQMKGLVTHHATLDEGLSPGMMQFRPVFPVLWDTTPSVISSGSIGGSLTDPGAAAVVAPHSKRPTRTSGDPLKSWTQMRTDEASLPTSTDSPDRRP